MNTLLLRQSFRSPAICLRGLGGQTRFTASWFAGQRGLASSTGQTPSQAQVQTAAQIKAQQRDPGPAQKPKASTPLRRAASASLPIRANPTPTRGAIHQVWTLSTAERFVLPRLRAHLPPGAQPLGDAWWVPKWPVTNQDGAGEVFVYGNGSIVCWGMGEEDARRFAREVVDRPGVQIGALAEAETEELDFVTDPIESTRLQGDLIILGNTPPLSGDAPLVSGPELPLFPEGTLLARYAFSQALARSTALSALEESLDHYLQSVAALPRSLERTGKPGLSRIEVIKKLGQLMRFRQGLNLNRENFADTPDFYWTEPVLEGYFNSMSNALEMRARTRSVNDKITYAAEVQSVLRQLLTESSSHTLELVIIWLIAVEVVLALIREGPDLWEKVTGSKKTTEQTALSVE